MQSPPQGQETGVATQPPLLQWSPVVQASPSSHVTADPAFTCVHAPETVSQASTVHGRLSEQLFTVPLKQLPLWHVSLMEHALPSEQPVPLVMGAKTHPLAGAHASVVHALASSQIFTVPAHPPSAAHESTVVHALPSLQACPVKPACVQPPF